MEFTEWSPQRGHGQSVAEQVTARLYNEIHSLRSGARLPSVRSLAKRWGISPHTVVTVYERLMAQGLIESRPYSGFYVRPRARRRLQAEGVSLPELPKRVDLQWMLSSFMGQNDGAGVPQSWLDQERVLAAIRYVSRHAGSSLLDYGHSHGYPLLRQYISSQLEQMDIQASAEQHLLLCGGVTHAIDLILRHSLKIGDTVLVEQPAWYLVFARLAAAGVNVIGIPRLADGPDCDYLAQIAAQHKPVLMIMNSVVHNPTGSSLSLSKAYRLLQLAQEHDFFIVEDDTFSELHPGGSCRLAQLDQLERVILVGGYSKVLAAGLRCAYVAASPERVDALVRLKMLSGMTTPELSERVVYRLLNDGQQRKYLDRMRRESAADLQLMLERFAKLGLSPDYVPVAGMFVWLNTHMDGESLVKRLQCDSHLAVPGSLFLPDQSPSTYVRFSVSLLHKPEFWQALKRCLRA